MIDGLQLRNWMGNVDETIVAKHSARMGLVSSRSEAPQLRSSQPFSTSRIVNIDIRLKAELPDINRNGYCFTDGVAVAGREVMRQAARALGSTRGINAAPSAIQFRLGSVEAVRRLPG
jgi:RNA-dependent RNA polymerase